MVRAHIVPNAFFQPVKGRKNQVSCVDGKASRIAQSGPWDGTILCEDCERDLSPLDAYGVEFFRGSKFKHQEYTIEGIRVMFVKGVDQVKLWKFLTSLAWRVGVSGRREFKSIKIDEHLDRLAETFANTGKSPPGTFPVLLKRNVGSASLVAGGSNFTARDFLLSPCVIDDWFGRKTLQVCLAGYVVYMGLDDVEPKGAWKSWALGARPEVLVVLRDFDGSPEYREINGQVRAAGR